MISNKFFIFIVFCLLTFLPAISAAQEGYYHLGKEKLEFRLAVVNIKEAKGKNNWEKLTNLENKRFFVSRKVEIDSDDVDGVFVEKKMHAGYEIWHILIYFKKESWNKVRDITNRNIGRRLGVVKRGKLFIVPVIFEALDTQLDIAGTIDSSIVEWFVAGFTRAEEPPEKKADRGKRYEKFR